MIYLYDELRVELLGFAREEAPLEAVGLISAPKTAQAGEIPSYQLWRAHNASESPEDSFLIAPAEQTELLRKIWAAGEDLMGVVHSHPNSGPEPSERDRAIAASHVKPLTWVIVGQCTVCYGSGLQPGEDYECNACNGCGYEFWAGELP